MDLLIYSGTVMRRFSSKLYKKARLEKFESIINCNNSEKFVLDDFINS